MADIVGTLGEPHAPKFQAAGTMVSSTAAITVAWPTHQSGDIALLFVENANGAISFTNAAGFTALSGNPVGAGLQGVSGDTWLSVYWCRASSGAMTSPAIADPGNHVAGVILTFRGCVASGDPVEVNTTNSTDTMTTAVTVNGTTTLGANRLVVVALSWTSDQATGQWSSATNSNLADIASRFDEGTTQGNGGGLSIFSARKEAAGDYGSTTGTLGVSSRWSAMSLALAPVAVSAVTMPAMTLVATGELASAGIEGTATIAMPAMTLAATGALAIAGAATVAMPAMTLSAVIALQGAVYSGPTTGDLVRDRCITSLEALVFGSGPAMRAHRHEYGIDLEEWAEAHPQSALRRFSVREQVPQDRQLLHAHVDVEQRQTRLVLLVAYPHDHRHGPAGALNRDDVMRSDRFAIESAIGLRGYSNFESDGVAAMLVGATTTKIRGQSCDFLMVTSDFRFMRSLAAS